MGEIKPFPTTADALAWAQNARAHREVIAEAIEQLVALLDEIRRSGP